MQQDITPTNEIKRCPPHRMEMEGQQILKVRDDRIDSVKYWLIILVIAGHVVSAPEFSNSMVCVVLKRWIYIFHMPLFIFISGYFSRKKDKKDFLPSIWKILEPLIIFHVIIRIVLYLLNGTEDNLFVTLLTPRWTLWYLFCLIYWRLMIQFVPNKILRHTKTVIIVSFCISILAGFLPLARILSIQRSLAFMPFFFLGYYMSGKNLYLSDKYKPLCFVFLTAMFSIPLFCPQILGNLLHATPYKDVYGAASRMFTFALAIPMSIAFVNVCYNTSWIAQQGRLSMQYYIYHALIIPPLIAVVCKLNIPMSFVTAAIIAIGIICIIAVLLKIPYFRMMTNPSLFIKK